jgi:sugar lactone lactonase YvrE
MGPSAPGNLTATTLSPYQIDLTWSASTDNLSIQANLVYQICKSTATGGCTDASFTALATTGAGSTSYSVTGLNPATQYYFKVRAVDEMGNIGLVSGEVGLKTYAVPTAPPTAPQFNYPGGTYSTTLSIGITSNSAIYYTIDGTTPNCTGTGILYNQPYAVPITTTTTLQAIACQSPTVFSSVTSATYTLQPPAAPQFSLVSGSYATAQSVAITSASPGAMILYTKDGVTTPNCSGAGILYIQPIAIKTTTTLKAIVCGGSLISAVATGTYTITTPSPTTTQMGGSRQLNGGNSLYIFGVVTSFAGKSSVDGVASAAGFDNPSSITSDGTNLYVADTYNHTIRKIVMASGVVTTLAGTAGVAGSTDGTGNAARFNLGYDMTAISAGITTDGTNLYVADRMNATIRKIVITSGVVTTLAGTAGSWGSTDGTGNAARFVSPSGITSDGTNLYVADTYSHTIRKIVIVTGVVTTLAGTAGSMGSSDGVGNAARFYEPYGLTTDGTSLYVADYRNYTIRKIVISTGVVTTLAGMAGLGGSSDGTGTTARFYFPAGINTDGTNLYVADIYNHTIRKIVIATGVVTTLAGTAGLADSTDATGTAARFNVPIGIITDGTNLYVADTNNNTIRKIVISTGVVTTLAGSTGNVVRFSYARNITSDGTNLYVVDGNNRIIRKIVISSGVVTTLAGTAGAWGSTDGTGTAARFNNPFGITSDGTNLYVADTYNHTIRKIVISSGVVTTLAGTAGSLGSIDGTGNAARFNYPYTITTDGTNLYVADTYNHTIRKLVISTGVVTTLAGTAGSLGSTDGTGTAARFYYPRGITTDGTNLYVADTSNQTIRKIVIATGVVTTLAGTVGAGGSTDGTGTAARFYWPSGINSDGTNLYVSDSGNNTIRKIVIASGVVTTLAGTAGSSGSTDGVGNVARFSSPQGITTDGTNLYVADTNNFNIRKIE